MAKRVIFCTPTMVKPYQAYLDAMEKTVPFLEDRGWSCQSIYEIGCPYISHARSKMLRKACDAINHDPDSQDDEFFVFIDHDLSWEPEDMLELLEYPVKGHVVAGTYRFKNDGEVSFMGRPTFGEEHGAPICREINGKEAIVMHSVPAGFLRIDKHVVNHFMKAFPDLIYGETYRPCIDLFNHGAHGGTWYGEDYAFSRRWREAGGQIFCLPKLNLTHYAKDADGLELPYEGTYHDYLISKRKKQLVEVKAESAA